LILLDDLGVTLLERFLKLKEYVGGRGYMRRVWDHALREKRNITLPNLHWCIHRDLCKDFYTCYWASAGTGLHLDEIFIAIWM